MHLETLITDLCRGGRGHIAYNGNPKSNSKYEYDTNRMLPSDANTPILLAVCYFGSNRNRKESGSIKLPRLHP